MSRIGFQHSEMAKEKCRIANLGMHSSPATEFWRGHVPWNRGKKGTHFSFATEFKKGQRSTNWKPVGTITVRRDKGSGTLRRWIKIKNPNCWQEYAKYLWLKSGRKLKKGFILGHKDGDSTNDSLGNLILTTRNKYVSMCNRWNTKNTFHSKEEWQARAKAGLKCPRTPFMSKTKPHCSLSCDTVSNLKLRITELIGDSEAKDLEIFRLATKLSQAEGIIVHFERAYIPPKPIVYEKEWGC